MEINQRSMLLSQTTTSEQQSTRPVRKRRAAPDHRILWLVVSCSTAVTLLLIMGTYLVMNNYYTRRTFPVDHTLLEVEKCPACAGQSLCPYFFGNEIHLSNPTELSSSPAHGIDCKIGLYKNARDAHLRRIGAPSTPNLIDDAVCRRGTRHGSSDAPSATLTNLHCIPHLAIWRWLPTNGLAVETAVHRGIVAGPIFTASQIGNLSEDEEEDMWSSSVMRTAYAPATRCSSDRLFHRLMSSFRERTSFGAETRWLRFDELLFLFQLAVDPQALIWQAFPRSNLWPFPTYVGSCGRWIVQKNHGVPLGEFCESSIWKRLRIIRNILRLPGLLSRPSDPAPSHQSLNEVGNDDGYVIYLGNFDLANVLNVNPTTLDVTVSNLRHAIVVDTKTLLNLGYSNTSEYVVSSSAINLVTSGVSVHQCEGNISSSGDAGGTTPPCVGRVHADQLCSHVQSDHNEWAVCTALLYGHVSSEHACARFLDGLPRDFRNTLQHCVHEALPGSRKASIGKALNIINSLIQQSG